MRIVILSESTYPEHGGGSGKCSHQMAAGLAARGHTVHLVCETKQEPRREQIDGVDILRLPEVENEDFPRDEHLDTTRALWLLARIESAIPLREVDLVHDSGSFLSYFFRLTHQLRKIYGIPLVVHFRYLILRHQVAVGLGTRYDPLLYRPYLSLEACCKEATQCFPVRISDRVIVPSTDEAEFVRRIYKPEPDHVVVVPDPVTVSAPSPLTRHSLRTRLARPRERLVLYGGRIEDELKGSDVVLRAFQRVVSRKPGVRLLLAAREGNGLARFREALGDSVTCLGWIGNADDLARILAAVDLVWMPSLYESFGMMCAESLAVGTPVVGSPVGGLRDMIVPGETGFLLNASDPERWEEELVHYTLQILSDPELAVRMRRNCLSLAERSLSGEKAAEQLEGLYLDVLSKREHRTVEPPRFLLEDRQAYLALLSEWRGTTAVEAGRAALIGWKDSVEERCDRCSRALISEHTRRLLALSPRRGSALAEAVQQACPLALLQKQSLRKGRGKEQAR